MFGDKPREAAERALKDCEWSLDKAIDIMLNADAIADAVFPEEKISSPDKLNEDEEVSERQNISLTYADRSNNAEGDRRGSGGTAEGTRAACSSRC